MIIATVTIESEWERGKVNTREIEFETVPALVDYLNYNRSYIKKISFEGAIEIKEDD